MSFDEYRQMVAEASPPAGLPLPLLALWHDARGDWPRAHECAQRAPGSDGAWVHAYLHRKEGDDANAAYWYARAGRAESALTFEEEWDSIVRGLLAR
ncbi:MAG TPA: hypothetical protein VLW52_01375 [Opitutaceae bacterium]|nr:hypothetical protein [Opitutaceae bacterium]